MKGPGPDVVVTLGMKNAPELLQMGRMVYRVTDTILYVYKIITQSRAKK